MLQLLLTTKRFEAVIEVLDDAGMFDTYDPLLRHIVAWSAFVTAAGGRHGLSGSASLSLLSSTLHFMISCADSAPWCKWEKEKKIRGYFHKAFIFLPRRREATRARLAQNNIRDSLIATCTACRLARLPNPFYKSYTALALPDSLVANSAWPRHPRLPIASRSEAFSLAKACTLLPADPNSCRSTTHHAHMAI